MLQYKPPRPLERALPPEGRNALGIAASEGAVDAFEELVEVNGFNPNKVDKLLELPLHIAASYGNLDVCKVCLAYMDGQGMDQENFEGCTPLGCALAYGHVEVAAFLVKNGANAWHSSVKTGYTPLMFAAWYSSLESVEWLLHHKLGDVRAENAFGCTAFDMAPPGPIRTVLHRRMRQS